MAIATRHPVRCSRPFSDEFGTRSLWGADGGPFTFCGVFIPLGEAKWTCWASLIERGRRSGVDLVIGDFNTGYDDLDK